MKYKLKKTQEANDIVIANISTKKVRSNNIMNIVDFSSRYRSNNISLLKEIKSGTYNRIEGTPSVVSKYLNRSNIFSNILLTDEYKYDKKLGTTIPLYYIHRINQAIYTNKVLQKSIACPSVKIIENLIPDNGKYIIPEDSIVVSHLHNNSEYLLPQDEFRVNYGNGSIELDSAVPPDHEIVVTYLLVEDNFIISNPNNYSYRIRLEQLGLGITDFRLSILSSSIEPIEIIFTALDYSENIREYTQSTIGELLYGEVYPENQTSVSSNYKIKTHSIEYNPITSNEDICVKKTISLSGDTTSYDTEIYTFKSETQTTSKVKLVQVPNVDYDKGWMINVTPGYFYSEEYPVLYGVIPSLLGRIKVTDTPIRVTKSILSINMKDIIVSIGETGAPANVIVKRNGNPLTINKIDTYKGLIYLEENTTPTDILTVDYYVKNNIVEYGDINLNPLSIKEGIDLTQYIIVFLFPPAVTFYKELYHVLLPRYSKNGIINYDYDKIYDLLNGPVNIRDQIPGLSDLELPPADIIPIGYVYLSNCLDEDGFLLEDARTYGGGILDNKAGFFDISFYDGEKTDLNTILHVFIKQRIVDELYTRVLNYDREVQSYRNDIPAMEKLAHIRTMEIINNKVEKFIPFGSEWEIIIE